MPKVSVIIPVYKAEPYIERCVRTLFEQTLDEVEYIFIDDCSPDKSMNILTDIMRQYPKRQDNIKIIRHIENKGVGTSRQEGLECSSGEFIIYCDPDDWVEPEMYENLYNAAVQTQVDVVICNYVLEYSGHSERKPNSIKSTDSHYLLEQLVEGKLHGSTWSKLIRKKFAIDNNISFTKGLNICEDWAFCIKLFKSAPRTHILDQYLYHYDKFSNTNSLTRPSTPHRKVQNELLYNSVVSIFEGNLTVPVFRTAITYVSYWAFAHNVLSVEDFRRCYKSHFWDVVMSRRNFSIKIIIITALLGLHKPMYDIYKTFLRLK